MRKSLFLPAFLFLLGTFIGAEPGILGKPAPDFSRPDRNQPGLPLYTLSAEFGKSDSRPVVLTFFSTWCPYCVEELRFLKRLTDSLYAGKFKVATVCVDRDYGEQQDKFVQNLGFAWPVVSDTGGVLSLSFKAPRELPYAVVMDKEGIVSGTTVGFRGNAQKHLFDQIKRVLGIPVR